MSQKTVTHEWGRRDTLGVCLCRVSQQLGVPLGSGCREPDNLEQNTVHVALLPEVLSSHVPFGWSFTQDVIT